MQTHRSRAEMKEYWKYQKDRRAQGQEKVCVYCSPRADEIIVLKQTKHFMIMQARFGYSLWDGQEVQDHLMIVPKKHTDRLSALSDKEGLEFFKLISSYEGKGYNLYARAPGSATKSFAHQHTHLIKSNGKRRKTVVFSEKPYIRFAI